MLAALFIGGAQHGVGSIFLAPWDKLAHLLFFCGFTLFLYRGFSFKLTTISVIALLVGLLDELHQIYLPERVSSVGDWLADAVGVAVAISIIFLLNQ